MMQAYFWMFGLILASFAAGCSRKPPEIIEVSLHSQPISSNLTTKVPQLTGVPRDWALQLVCLKQLHGVSGRLYLADDHWQSDWVEGRVYIQNPMPSTVTKIDTPVTFWTVHHTAVDDALVEVPRVIGSHLDKAIIEIERAGLTHMIVKRAPTNEEETSSNTVIDQFPRSPQVLGPMSTVLLHVSDASTAN